MRRFMVTVILPLVLAGCTHPMVTCEPVEKGQTILFKVLQAEEQLGHSSNINEKGLVVHEVWCSGCRGRLADKDENIVIWWCNKNIKDYPFRFEEGKTYLVEFTGELGKGILEYKGKSLELGQIVRVEEK